jgi:hypothetical protein
MHLHTKRGQDKMEVRTGKQSAKENFKKNWLLASSTSDVELEPELSALANSGSGTGAGTGTETFLKSEPEPQ